MYEKVFTYGSLKNPTKIQKILGRIPKKNFFILKGYGLSSVKDGKEIFPGIVPKDSGRIFGIIWLIKRNEWILLDNYEGKAYTRQKISQKDIDFYVYFPKSKTNNLA